MPIIPLDPKTTLHNKRYLIVRIIGYGGFGNTYLAFDQTFKNHCVVKEFALDMICTRDSTNATISILHNRENEMAKWLDKFTEEARNLSLIRHLGVVNAFDIWREKGTAFYAMEHIEGGELPDPMEETWKPMAWSEAKKLAIAILEALKAVHKVGLIHGDIKPANILIDKETKQPILIDFGTARSLKKAQDKTVTSLAYTIGYAPVELQDRKRSKEANSSSDLYSWAMVVIGLVKKHHDGGRPVDAKTRIMFSKENVDKYSEKFLQKWLANSLPASVISILADCLQLNSNQRPQSASIVLDQLENSERNSHKPKPFEQAPIKPKPFEQAPVYSQKPSDLNSRTKDEKTVLEQNDYKIVQEQSYENFQSKQEQNESDFRTEKINEKTNVEKTKTNKAIMFALVVVIIGIGLFLSENRNANSSNANSSNVNSSNANSSNTNSSNVNDRNTNSSNANSSNTNNNCGANSQWINGECLPSEREVISGIETNNEEPNIMEPVYCGNNEFVLSHACELCASGLTNEAGDDASGDNTVCEVTYCGNNEFVLSHACEPCTSGLTNEAGDDASGDNTACAPEGFAWIPAGSFMMGSPDNEVERTRWNNNERLHEVTISRPFYMQTHEVTQGEWRTLMRNNPSRFSRSGDGANCGYDCPVEMVNWWEALAYANALSESFGLQECYDLSGCRDRAGDDMECRSVSLNSDCGGYRLPTEAQWEYAARAGTTSAYYNGEETPDDIAWSGEGWNSGSTHPVGQLEANSWGLYDMSGNVLEWCWDRYGPYRSSSVTDPMGPNSGSNRVLRGGSWNHSAVGVRLAFRNDSDPDTIHRYSGFRLVSSVF